MFVSTEIVRAMTYVINQGMSMYWGTSRWTAMEIMVSNIFLNLSCHEMLHSTCHPAGHTSSAELSASLACHDRTADHLLPLSLNSGANSVFAGTTTSAPLVYIGHITYF